MPNLNLEKLPSPPGVAAVLLELYSAPDVSLDELHRAISADPVLTARVIKYANSPMFARRREAGTLKQAITMLGANGVRFIALSFSLTEIRPANGGTEGKFSFDSFWSSSLATAVCAQRVCTAMNGNGEAGFLAGLLLNVGQLALYCNNPSEYERAMGELRNFDIELIELEKSVWGEDRYKLGSQVLTAWSFPENIARTLADVGANCSSNQSRALHLAYQLSNLMLIDKPDYVLVRTVLDSLGKLAGIADDAAENLFTESVREYGEIATILSFENPDKKSLAEIELEAKSRMIELTMQMHVQTAQVAEENSELKDLVFVDPLTKLGNRRQYDRIATAELNRCIRSKNPFGLMVIDIDHFKRVNDTYGHAVGDAILAGVARRLELSVRNYDFVFRFGGEEFVVILPESNSRICQGVAERLRLAMESKNFLVDEHDIHVTISIGVAAFDPGNGVDIETLFESADQALYAAKKNGRNQYLIASSFAATIPPINLNAAAASTQANQLS